MSFIVGRLAAGREAAYFLQESKHAVARLAEKTNDPVTVTTANSRLPTATIHQTLIDNQADILPEILKHNLPSKIFRPASDSTLSTGSKWLLHSDESNGVSFAYRDAINPLSAYVSLPQATFGPRRWQLPSTENPFFASTANDLRHDKYTPIDTDRFKAAALGLPQSRFPSPSFLFNRECAGQFMCTLTTPIYCGEQLRKSSDYGVTQIGVLYGGAPKIQALLTMNEALKVNRVQSIDVLINVAKAFAVATAVVFSGASLMIGLAALQLDLHTIDDVQTRGKVIVQPKIESIREQMIPFRTWAEDVGKKWRMEKEDHMKEKPLVKELRRMLGAKRST